MIRLTQPQTPAHPVKAALTGTTPPVPADAATDGAFAALVESVLPVGNLASAGPNSGTAPSIAPGIAPGIAPESSRAWPALAATSPDDPATPVGPVSRPSPDPARHSVPHPAQHFEIAANAASGFGPPVPLPQPDAAPVPTPQDAISPPTASGPDRAANPDASASPIAFPTAITPPVPENPTPILLPPSGASPGENHPRQDGPVPSGHPGPGRIIPVGSQVRAPTPTTLLQVDPGQPDPAGDPGGAGRVPWWGRNGGSG